MAHYDSLCFRIGYYLYTKTLLGYCYHRQDIASAMTRYSNGHSTCIPIKFGQLKIVPIPLSLDNYAFLIMDEGDGSVVLVDPSDPAVIQAVLHEMEVVPSAILATHKHWDHSAGNTELRTVFPNLRVYSNRQDEVPGMTDHLDHGSKLVVGQRLQFTALHTPGHTVGHVVFLLDGSPFGAPNSLFSGDLLFLGATGRAFECPSDVMLGSLDAVAALDGSTLLWPGHEYALGNMSFAATVDPTNEHVAAKLAWVKDMRRSDNRRCTCPSTIAEELSYNPFLRTDNVTTVSNVLAAIGSEELKTSFSHCGGRLSEPSKRAAVLECLLRAKKNYKVPLASQ